MTPVAAAVPVQIELPPRSEVGTVATVAWCVSVRMARKRHCDFQSGNCGWIRD
jgi:hypothetical protein